MSVVRPALAAGDAAWLARVVSARWMPRELCRLLGHRDVDVRRVVAVTLGLVGDATCVGCLTRSLHDPDDQVTEMAEHSLWSIWFRLGKPTAAKPFSEGVSLLCTESYVEALDRFEDAIDADRDFAEAYNQCAIAHFFLGDWEASLIASQQALALMPSHFGAMAGMGHCHAELGDLETALGCYRRAISINPRMKAIADAVHRLEARLREENDSSGMFELSTVRI